MGCGPTPENVGDECEPDGDPCPGGSVCAPGGEDHICQTKPGGSCNPSGADYCLGESVCTDNGEGGGICGTPEGGTCDPADPFCTGTLTCAELANGEHACFAPVLLSGMVFDASTTDAIEGAHVLALDDQSSALTDVSVSGPNGEYQLDVPIARNDDGSPIADFIVTLRASAQDYQTFPGGIRTSLPINTNDIVAEEDGWTLETTLTDIALIPLPAAEQGSPSISGAVLAGDLSGGVLVVAEPSGISAISDAGGGYTIFNVPDGSYEVSGYAAGVQLEPATAEVSGSDLVDVDLAESGDALGSISGSINIVNAPGGSVSSVVLVVASTFNDTFVRGEVPRGLRDPFSGPPSVSGAFTINDVPAGSYVVLAAFENDDLVRDPDPNIAGTQIVTVEMAAPGEDVALSDSFKVTEALAVVAPGATDAEPVTSAPMLTWADDSSEDFYSVVVYNAYGDLVWCLSRDDAMMGCDGPEVIAASGGGEVSVAYGGPLDPGMYYQFRATSWKQAGNQPPGPISATEDLRGVFFVPNAQE
jgi:hypothetical protein